MQRCSHSGLHKQGCTNSSKCNCYTGNVWLNATCSNPKECTDVCALDGEDERGYAEKYGVRVDGQGALNLTFVSHYSTTEGNASNVGSRMYLLDGDNHVRAASRPFPCPSCASAIAFIPLLACSTAPRLTQARSRPNTMSQYKQFNLLNREFTFTVDGSNLPCGLNAALYFVEMDVRPAQRP